jgi:hypothetical protein
MVALLASAPVWAQEMRWQDAVARLERERSQAVTCARVMRKYASGAAADRAAVDYGEAKAQYDAVIRGLVVALARKDQPASLSDLQARLQDGFERREAFCGEAKAMLPASRGGEKGAGVIEGIVSGFVTPLFDALKSIYFRSKDDNALMRATIQTQLEATVWPDFGSVTPLP